MSIEQRHANSCQMSDDGRNGTLRIVNFGREKSPLAVYTESGIWAGHLTLAQQLPWIMVIMI